MCIIPQAITGADHNLRIINAADSPVIETVLKILQDVPDQIQIRRVDQQEACTLFTTRSPAGLKWTSLNEGETKPLRQHLTI